VLLVNFQAREDTVVTALRISVAKSPVVATQRRKPVDAAGALPPPQCPTASKTMPEAPQQLIRIISTSEMGLQVVPLGS
jgi:hypothetical protein